MHIDSLQLMAVGPLAAFGLVFGSFATALSYRLPRGESIARGRSRCPKCGHTLTAADLVPVLSWVAHKGACRHCHAQIPWRYPAIEVLTMVLFVGAGLLAPDVERLVLLLAMTPMMVTAGVIDLEHRRVPNVLVALLAILAVLWRWHLDQGLLAAFALAVGVAVFGILLDMGARAARLGAGLGMGDTKLFAIVALALPLGYFLLFAVAAGALGLCLGLLWQWRERSRQVPFAPAILAAYWLALTLAHPALRQIAALRLG